MLTETDPPATSTPVPALTNLTVCIPELPATQTRPSEVTVSELAPTVNFMPAKLEKLFLADVPANEVRNAVEPPPLGLIVVRSFQVSLLTLVSPPPDTVAVLVTLAGALAATFTVTVRTG